MTSDTFDIVKTRDIAVGQEFFLNNTIHVVVRIRPLTNSYIVEYRKKDETNPANIGAFRCRPHAKFHVPKK